LLQELKGEFEKLSSIQLSLSIAVKSNAAKGEVIANQAYDFDALAKYVDYINVMTYDHHSAVDNQTGHHSSLEDSEAALEYYYKKGVPKEKLLIGVAFYGHTFTLKDPNNHKIGAPTIGAGKKLSSGEGGSGNYWEICVNVKNNGWTKEQTTDGHNPIAYHLDQWVGYDDPNQAS